MVTEIATLFIRTEAESDFLQGFHEGVKILRRQKGCKKLRWGKRVESELAYILEVDWVNIEDHFKFRETEDYVEFGRYFRQYLSKNPEVVHFASEHFLD